MKTKPPVFAVSEPTKSAPAAALESAPPDVVEDIPNDAATAPGGPATGVPASPQGANPRAPKLTREAEAKLRLENTVVTPRVAWAVCALFLMTICSVPLIQFVAKSRVGQAVLPAMGRSGLLPASRDLKTFETSLEEESVVASHMLPRTQGLLTNLGMGNENAYVGREGWLVYRPDINYVTGKGFLEPAQLHHRSLQLADDGEPVQPDPIPAIVRFKEQLAARGITLVLLPIPLKPMLEAQHLAPGYENLEAPLQNPSYERFLHQMQANKVLVCDPTTALFQSADGGKNPQYLRTDTHWTPGAMRTTADVLATFVDEHAALPLRQADYIQQPKTLTGSGDIAHMLDLPDAQRATLYPPQQVEVEQVMMDKKRVWKPSKRADVMLLGDSFTNIFSRKDLGWGEGAGLAEQLSYRLHRRLDVIALNAGGAYTARQQMRIEMQKHPERFERTRLVVWQFAMRDLQSGNWKKLDLPNTPSTRPPLPIVRPGQIEISRPVNPATLKRFRRALFAKTDAAQEAKARVIDGANGWMFYLGDAQYVASRGFLHKTDNPQLDALLDFKRQLDKRGIQLIVMPMPSKATIYPEKLGLAGVEAPRAPQNPDFERFCTELQDKGITVFDPTASLLREKRQTTDTLYMPTDTHWTWAGMDSTAESVADLIDPRLPQLDPVGYTRQKAEVANITDVSFMLPRRPGNPQLVHMQQTVQQVKTPDGKLWKASPDADVLVLGDSFVNIYSHGGAWGKSAGFAEQLSFYLQRPVDSIAMDAGGINNTRLSLQRDMKTGRDRLANKKIVIYEVGARYLVRRDWQKIELPTAKDLPRATNKTPAPLNDLFVTATIKARSAVPPAATTPYPEMVMALQLTNVKVTGKAKPSANGTPELLVYVWGLRNSAVTPMSALKVGQQVTLRLTPWSRVEDQFGSFNRTEVENSEAALLDAYWGVEAGP